MAIGQNCIIFTSKICIHPINRRRRKVQRERGKANWEKLYFSLSYKRTGCDDRKCIPVDVCIPHVILHILYWISGIMSIEAMQNSKLHRSFSIEIVDFPMEFCCVYAVTRYCREITDVRGANDRIWIPWRHQYLLACGCVCVCAPKSGSIFFVVSTCAVLYCMSHILCVCKQEYLTYEHDLAGKDACNFCPKYRPLQ